MRENFVIPYNDRCDEEIYNNYFERMNWLISQGLHLSYSELCNLARSTIIDNLVTHNSYQQYYTIHQVNHLSERFANAFLKRQDKLYIF